MPDQEETYRIDAEGNVVVDYQESSFEPIPSAEYDLIVQNVEVKEGRKSQKPYFAFEFRTSDPDPDLDNKVIWENISPSAAWRVTQLIQAVYGVDEDLAEGDQIEFNIFDLFGAKVRARVGLEEVKEGSRQGEMRNCITRFLPAGEDYGALDSEQPAKKAAKKKKAPAKKKSTAKKKASTKRKRKSSK